MVDAPPVPLEYKAGMDVRFSDCDQYGHVNAALYLDYVSSARWAYLRKEFSMGLEAFSARDLGFYLTESKVCYKKQISEVNRIMVRSRTISETYTRMVVSFEITSEDEKLLYADGNMTFVIMDLKRQRPRKLPDWAFKYFYLL